MLYFLLGLCSSFIGSISGLGGGVILKPLLELFSPFSMPSIHVLSAFTVFSMAIASLFRHIQSRANINFRLTILLAIGAWIGGYFGNAIFQSLLLLWHKETRMVILQNVLLALLLLAVLLYMNFFRTRKHWNIQNIFAIFAIGLTLGTLSSFLGIGGGPINMLALALFFSMPTKESAINSLVLIFFSQASKLLTIAVSTGFSAYQLDPLLFLIPAGLLGGIFGSTIGQKISETQVLTLFTLTNIAIIAISIGNCIRILF